MLSLFADYDIAHARLFHFAVNLECLAQSHAGGRESLWQLDIPRFTARGDENALNAGSKDPIVGCYVNCAWDTARAKIESLCETDLRWQLALIVGTFDVRSANLGNDGLDGSAGEEYGEIEPLGKDKLLDIAADLANEVEAKAKAQSKPKHSVWPMERLVGWC